MLNDEIEAGEFVVFKHYQFEVGQVDFRSFWAAQHNLEQISTICDSLLPILCKEFSLVLIEIIIFHLIFVINI